MTTLYGLLIVLALSLSLVAFVATVELFRDLAQLREVTGVIDRSDPVDLGAGAGRRPSEVGLPSSLDAAVDEAALVLSTRCGTCRAIAHSIGPRWPSRIVPVLIEPSAEKVDEFITAYDLPRERVHVDSDQSVIRHLGNLPTPCLVFVGNGIVSHAQSVPSSRQFWILADRLIDGTVAKETG